jgi:Mg-chelatase subunit ChlD
VVVLDTSGSMKKRLDDAKVAAKSFVDELATDDKVRVLGFAREVKLLSIDGNRPSAKAAIDATVARGDTALYDALYSSVALLKDTPGRKAIALLSDGADDDGAGRQLSKHSVDEALALARAPSEEDRNIKDFELSAGDSPTGPFKLIGRFRA